MSSLTAWAGRAAILACALGVGYGISNSSTGRDARVPDGATNPRAPFDSLRVVRPGEATSSSIARSGKPALILVFDVSCEHCADQIEAWKAVARLIDERVEVIGISTSSVGNSQLYPLFEGGFVQYAGVAPVRRLQETLGLTGVPFTALLDEKDRVLATRQGVLSETNLRSLVRPYLAFRSPK